MRLPILTQKDMNKETFDLWQFILFWSIGAVFYSIMSSIYIIYHYSSHSTWSKLMKIPMHIEFAWLMGKYHEKFSFWQYMQFWSIWAVFHSIVKSYWKENMVCINSPSKLPTCIKFWWKKMNSQWIWLIFAIFDFLSDFVGLLWPFFGGLNASRIAKYDSCHQKPSWTGISAQKQPIFPIIFAFQALLLSKIDF